MEPFSYASAAYVVASALVSVRLFCKNLGNLKKFFGQMVYRPPWQKITRTPMFVSARDFIYPKILIRSFEEKQMLFQAKQALVFKAMYQSAFLAREKVLNFG